MKIPFLLLCIFFSCYAKTQNIQFVENKGQLNNKAKFSSILGNSNFFLEQSGYKIVLNNSNDLSAIANYFSGHDSAHQNNAAKGRKLILHSHAYEVKFQGALLPEIIPSDSEDTYNNYFTGNDPSKWISHCKIYNSIIYKNVYPNIDVKFYSKDNRFTYDFIVHPGGDVNNIALLFDGIDGLTINNENLVVKTSLGDISELKPYSYQQTKAGKRTIKAKYFLSKNVVHLKIENYDKTATLVIDPTLVFSTFVGSTSDNWGYCSTYDAQGNFYTGSISFGTGFPVSNGAYQTIFGGGQNEEQLGPYDVTIMKLNPTGTNRLYATYLGGSGNEQPHNLKIDNNGNLIVAGRTSSMDFPSTSSVYGQGGNYDLFVSKLSEDGSKLVASRRIGGSFNDGINIRSKEIPNALSISRNYGDDARSEIEIDANNNLYFVSCTQSFNFPVTSGCFQTNFGGGAQDGIIVKLNPDFSKILFSSFLGGNGDDGAFSVALNSVNNNIYIAGSTTSTNLKGTSVNSGPILFNSFQGGICDGFITAISNDGSSQIKTCYVGTIGNDMLYIVRTDHAGFPYITGTTTSAFPLLNTTFQSQSKGKQFITKLKADLSGIVYSTNYGKGESVPDICPTAFDLDDCGNVYVAGWGGGLDVSLSYPNATTSGLSVTPDAIRTTTDNSDFYIFVLEKNAASQLYGSFYGNNDTQPDVGDHTDGGISRFDKQGNLYLAICANCGKIGTFPTTAGAWSPINQAQVPAYCNMAAVKINFNFAKGCLLPVTLLEFAGEYSNHQVILQWKTTQEVNSNYFIVERSTDGKNFIEIGNAKANNSKNVTSYTFDDGNFETGSNYYRLKLLDKDGKFKYSNIISFVINKEGTLYVYPNPAKTEITIVHKFIDQPAQLLIINSLGITVKKIHLMYGTEKTKINIQSFAPGWYSLRITENSKMETTSFLKE